MVDGKALRSKITGTGRTYTFIAKELGLTTRGLDNKLNGDSDFKVSEAMKLKDILPLSWDEFKQIFFTVNV